MVASRRLTLVIILTSCLGSAIRAEPGPSFAGKTITVVIGNAAGGTTDIIGRLFDQTLAQHLPGTPRMVVSNQPGAEGVTALNNFIRMAKPDGLTITVGAATQSDPLFYRSAHAVYDLTKFAYLGGIEQDGSVLLLNKKALARLKNSVAEPVTMGALAGLRPGMYMNLWGTQYLGWNTRWVLGYANTSDLKLALLRGEVDMTALGSATEIDEVLRTGKFVAMTQTGYMKDDKLLPRKGMENVPLLSDQVMPRLHDPEAKRAFDYWRRVSLVGTWVALPPGVQKDVVNVYEKAMDETLSDPTFIQATANVKPDAVAMNHSEVQSLLTDLANTPESALAYLTALKKKQGLQ